MRATSRIASVRRGSHGPFDARPVRRTTGNAPYYTSLPDISGGSVQPRRPHNTRLAAPKRAQGLQVRSQGHAR
jgi:hypothetical protein